MDEKRGSICYNLSEMNIKQQIDTDLKTAMLAGDKVLATTLRGLKSVILYAEVAAGSRDSGGLDDATIIDLFSKEAKKRQDSADLYRQGGSSERMEAELAEKAVIEQYLPKQLSDDEIRSVIEKVISGASDLSPQMMGKVIAAVKDETKGTADGGRIAALVKERLVK
jgi:uncharacterized protein YqeY